MDLKEINDEDEMKIKKFQQMTPQNEKWEEQVDQWMPRLKTESRDDQLTRLKWEYWGSKGNLETQKKKNAELMQVILWLVKEDSEFKEALNQGKNVALNINMILQTMKRNESYKIEEIEDFYPSDLEKYRVLKISKRR